MLVNIVETPTRVGIAATARDVMVVVPCKRPGISIRTTPQSEILTSRQYHRNRIQFSILHTDKFPMSDNQFFLPCGHRKPQYGGTAELIRLFPHLPSEQHSFCDRCGQEEPNISNHRNAPPAASAEQHDDPEPQQLVNNGTIPTQLDDSFRFSSACNIPKHSINSSVLICWCTAQVGGQHAGTPQVFVSGSARTDNLPLPNTDTAAMRFATHIAYDKAVRDARQGDLVRENHEPSVRPGRGGRAGRAGPKSKRALSSGRGKSPAVNIGSHENFRHGTAPLPTSMPAPVAITKGYNIQLVSMWKYSKNARPATLYPTAELVMFPTWLMNDFDLSRHQWKDFLLNHVLTRTDLLPDLQGSLIKCTFISECITFRTSQLLTVVIIAIVHAFTQVRFLYKFEPRTGGSRLPRSAFDGVKTLGDLLREHYPVTDEFPRANLLFLLEWNKVTDAEAIDIPAQEDLAGMVSEEEYTTGESKDSDNEECQFLNEDLVTLDIHVEPPISPVAPVQPGLLAITNTSLEESDLGFSVGYDVPYQPLSPPQTLDDYLGHVSNSNVLSQSQSATPNFISPGLNDRLITSPEPLQPAVQLELRETLPVNSIQQPTVSTHTNAIVHNRREQVFISPVVFSSLLTVSRKINGYTLRLQAHHAYHQPLVVLQSTHVQLVQLPKSLRRTFNPQKSLLGSRR